MCCTKIIILIDECIQRYHQRIVYGTRQKEQINSETTINAQGKKINQKLPPNFSFFFCTGSTLEHLYELISLCIYRAHILINKHRQIFKLKVGHYFLALVKTRSRMKNSIKWAR